MVELSASFQSKKRIEGRVTKEEMVTWLEEVVESHKGSASETRTRVAIAAADLLASLNGWRIQNCTRRGGPMRDSRLDKIGPSKR